jgi:hypothetical protein
MITPKASLLESATRDRLADLLIAAGQTTRLNSFTL